MKKERNKRGDDKLTRAGYAGAETKDNTVAPVLLWSGIALLTASYFLPAIQGNASLEFTLRGWEVALFILTGTLSFMNGVLEALLAGLFICNVVLILGIAFLILKRRMPAWYLPALGMALLYVLGFTFLNFGFGQLGTGFYAYIFSYLLVGAACFLKRSKREANAVQAAPVSE
ncbi:MAG: hypothetical protein P8126_04820 [Gammaproteobacteria bacterium]